MKLMQNKYLKFDEIEFNNKIVQNTTSLNLLPDIPEKFYGNEYMLEYKVDDDRLLEALSFELYDSTDYWDILFVYNKMSNMNELPVNYDIVLNKADKKMYEWKQKGKLLPENFTDEIIDKKYKEILEEEVKLNEKYRIINILIQQIYQNLKQYLIKYQKKQKLIKIL